ncbi:hypothetical protein HPP92_010031 [Vanilla planifolia]|uniref:Uncharacterized protein n=1 Tax=Vanilla planifolia TaxID=51239 RepID=A0A835R9Q1_VANPL|nr:hypothetical protein HPP92_010031 [Vanilla planifolia]
MPNARRETNLSFFASALSLVESMRSAKKRHLLLRLLIMVSALLLMASPRRLPLSEASSDCLSADSRRRSFLYRPERRECRPRRPPSRCLRPKMDDGSPRPREADYVGEKRTVPTGPNPLHN